MASQAHEEVDLVIIGGGPTGLFSAVLARQLGLSVTVIDEKPSSLKVGRADALNARTQQYLEVAGVLGELRAKGIECNTSSTFAEGDFKSRQDKWWTGLEHCRHKNFLMIGQPEVERTLLEQLDDKTPVRFGERVTSIREDSDSVTVTTDAGRTTHAQFAIGADGAKSTVRQALGIGFQGTKPEMIWAVLDTFLDTDFPICSEIITFQLDGQSRVSWIPRERGMSRFYVLLDGDVTQEKAEKSIQRHLAPYRVNFVRTEWFSTFEVRERIASTFVTEEKGRVMLAGDAAHVHSVNGGQGLNTGIADAFGLVWRLALASGKGKQVASDLIRTYDLERRTVAQDVINVAARLVRDTMHTAKQYVATIEKNAGYITGMGVSYHEIASCLIVESERGIWKAGRRCPDLVLASPRFADEGQRWLYSLARYGRFLVLAIGASPNDLQSLQRFRHAADIFVLTARDGCDSAVDTSGTEDSCKGALTFASDLVVSGDPFTVLVRPDMYIGSSSAHPAVPNAQGVDEKKAGESTARPVLNSGVTAWLQVLGAFCIYFNTWGLIASFGSFQAYYETDLLASAHHTAFEVSTIGSLQSFVLVFLGFLAGPLYDSGYARHLLTGGSALIVGGTLAQSFCSTLWQLLLAQGLCVGIGCGALAVLSVAIPSLWFTTRLPIANGVAGIGSGLGGVIFPIMVRNLLPTIGFGWTVRSIALVNLVLLGLASAVLRLPAASGRRRRLVDTASLTDWPYVIFVLGCFAVFLGLYTPFFYVPTYAVKSGFYPASSRGESFYIVMAMNLASIPGRIAPPLLAQRLGAGAVLPVMVATAVALGACALAFIGCRSIISIYVVACIYGFFTGSFFALQPTCFVSLTKDKTVMGTRFGMAFTVLSVALLFGSPISGALQGKYGYHASWIWAGVALFVGGSVIYGARAIRRVD
ncbi:hypothetical protein PG995_012644 [Apiospora arundinis]